MKRASVLLAVAERDSHAFRWLRLAAERRRAGLIHEAKTAVRASTYFDKPRLP